MTSEVQAAVERVTAKLAEIVSDDDVAKVHGNANFGEVTPREVVNDGVRKTAVGYHCGHTQFTILREHGLITKPPAGSYNANLTKKGKAYARVLYHAGDTYTLRAENLALSHALAESQISLEDMSENYGNAEGELKLAEERAEAAEAALATSEARRGELEGAMLVAWETYDAFEPEALRVAMKKIRALLNPQQEGSRDHG